MQRSNQRNSSMVALMLTRVNLFDICWTYLGHGHLHRLFFGQIWHCNNVWQDNQIWKFCKILVFYPRLWLVCFNPVRYVDQSSKTILLTQGLIQEPKIIYVRIVPGPSFHFFKLTTCLNLHPRSWHSAQNWSNQSVSTFPVAGLTRILSGYLRIKNLYEFAKLCLWFHHFYFSPNQVEYFLISHWLKWSILNQSQEIKAKMRSFKTEYQALKHIIPFI